MFTKYQMLLSRTRRALGTAVGFIGEHVKGKKVTEFNALDKLLFGFIWRSGKSDPVSNNPSYFSRVCAKCALKIWNAVELARFKANLNPIVADVNRLKQLPMTARLDNAGSVIRNLQRPEKNQSLQDSYTLFFYIRIYFIRISRLKFGVSLRIF